MTDTDDFLADMDKQIEWFCDRIMEPVPHNPQDQDKLFERMVTVGWVRQVEIDTYKTLTREDDE
jgi:hypothetical protein